MQRRSSVSIVIGKCPIPIACHGIPHQHRHKQVAVPVPQERTVETIYLPLGIKSVAEIGRIYHFLETVCRIGHKDTGAEFDIGHIGQIDRHIRHAVGDGWCSGMESHGCDSPFKPCQESRIHNCLHVITFTVCVVGSNRNDHVTHLVHGRIEVFAINGIGAGLSDESATHPTTGVAVGSHTADAAYIHIATGKAGQSREGIAGRRGCVEGACALHKALRTVFHLVVRRPIAVPSDIEHRVALRHSGVKAQVFHHAAVGDTGDVEFETVSIKCLIIIKSECKGQRSRIGD